MNKLHLQPFRYIATISYIVFIVVLNSLLVYLPHLNILGQAISIAEVFVGFIYIVRDFAQREIKHYVFVAMIIGGILSYALADKTIAIASVSAFIVGETIDWAVFTFTKRPLAKRLILSATLSAPVDSFIFLAVAGWLNWLSLTLMVIGKLVGVVILWWLWKLRASAIGNDDLRTNTTKMIV